MLPVVQDSLRAVFHENAVRPDSLESPLPGGIAVLVRFIFGVPQWIQIGGFVLALLVGGAVLVWLWRRRTAIAEWIRTRERGVKLGLAAGLLGLVALAGGGAAVSWNYMQHDNGFCTGCHVMERPFGLFQARAGKHDRLECHDCHQQSIYASTRQLVLWVAERPEKIGKHAKVPSERCAACHVDGKDQREKWQRVATTAGHRVHLESDSSALKDVECVTCHGEEVHKFVPVTQTCQQSGCHDQVRIELGKMAEQTSLHCVTCHQFTIDLPRLATRDSAAGALVPTNKQCLSCHAMQRVLATFDPERDPHDGTCGTCHDPHTQKVAAEAARTCASAGCHATWQKEPFHEGLAHRKVAGECIVCHQPHAAKVDPSDCRTCHERVRAAGATARGRRLAPPLPFDTTRALKRAAATTPPADRGGPVTGFLGWGWPTPPPRAASTESLRSASPADSFPHPRHRKLPCLTCHTSTARHGGLTFERPRGCQICHHQAPRTTDCATCHQADELAAPRPVTVTVSVPRRPPRPRPVGFVHPAHGRVSCVTCHTTPVSLAPDSTSRTCRGCHESHHETTASCAGCHGGLDLTPAHARPVEAHQGCAACHAERVVAGLVPTRPLCLTCHRPQERHYPARECTVCHFLATPAGYRAHLARVVER